MRIENMSIEKLQVEIDKSKALLNDFQKALNCIPETSILGRFGILISIKQESRHLERLEKILLEKNK